MKLTMYLLFVFSLIQATTADAQDYRLHLGDTYIEAGLSLDRYGIDTSDIQRIRSLIDTSAQHISELACVFLAERGFLDIAPRVKSLYYATIDGVPTNYPYLAALYLLRDPEVNQMLSAFMNRILENRKKGKYAPRSQIFTALELLVVVGDYSRFPTIDSLYSHYENIEYGGELDILASYGANPELRSRVFEILKTFINHPKRGLRISTLLNLRNFRDFPETQSIYRNVVANDIDDVVKDEAIRNLYVFYRDPFLLDLIEQVAKTAASETIFKDMFTWMAYVYRSPAALAAMIRIRDAVTQSDFREYAAHRVEFFSPLKPLDTLSARIMLDSLISNKHQVFALGWLADKNFVKELDNHLENAQKHLAKGDSVNTFKEVEKFQEKVNKEYQKTIDDEKKNKPRDKRFVTVEGWKFLYYNAQYILDRLPKKKGK